MSVKKPISTRICLFLKGEVIYTSFTQGSNNIINVKNKLFYVRKLYMLLKYNSIIMKTNFHGKSNAIEYNKILFIYILFI